MKSKNFVKKIFSILMIFTWFFQAVSVMAIDTNLDYPGITIQGQTFDLDTKQNLNEVIAWFYYFIVTISGFAAFAMLVFAGVQWMSSAGNPTAISDAKDRMQKALLGLLLILMSYAILNVLNPDLLTI